MSYKAAIFDLDGTLINSLADLAASANDMLESFGFPRRSLEEYRYFLGNGPRKLMERCLPKEQAIDTAMVDKALERYNAYYKNHLFQKTAPYEGILPMLDALQKNHILLGICTNKQQFASDALVEKLFPKGMFLQNLGDLEGTPRKPDPTKVLKIMKEFNVTPEETVYLGDSSTDMETARNAKCLAIGVSWGFRPEQELLETGADRILHHPSDLLDIIFERKQEPV